MTTPDETNISVPVRVDAFVLSPQVCDSDHSKICPITQPNYLFLRYEDALIENDVLYHHDLHAASPPELNARITDLGSATTHYNRLGVYLHWVLPRVYRSGTAATGSATGTQGQTKKQQGYEPYPITNNATKSNKRSRHAGGDPAPPPEPNYSAPDFRSAPNRWMIIRHLEDYTPTSPLPEFQAWVLESDRLSNINNLPPNSDIEHEYSPFINPESDGSTQVEGQSETFLGYRHDALTWSEYKYTGDPTKDADAPKRTKLNLMTASNAFFPDYQPHNNNVFSFVDNFSYPDPDPTHKDNTLYVDNAKASYFVLGWHSTNGTDALAPFNQQTQGLDPKDVPSYGDRLKSCLMQFPGVFPPAKDSPEQVWSDATMNAQNQPNVVCHGAMYNVTWNYNGAPAHIPADEVGKVVCENVAVGTTTLDALLAYVHHQVDPPAATGRETDVDPVLPTITEVEQDLIKIQTLLLKQEDGVDPQLEAEDILYEANFAKVDGGVKWHLAGQDVSTTSSSETARPGARASDPTPPATDNGSLLTQLNKLQLVLDVCKRKSNTLRWQLFAEWWKFVANPDSDPTHTHSPEYALNVQHKVQYLMDRLVQLVGSSISGGSSSGGEMADLLTQISGVIKSMTVAAEQGAAEKFYTQKDPTVLIAGLQSAWPQQFSSSNTTVRMDRHIVTQLTTSTPVWSTWSGFWNKNLEDKFPTSIQKTASLLAAEWDIIKYPSTAPSNAPTLSNGQWIPTFHDPSGKGLTAGYDSFADTQAWFPLFIEWEAIYYHIPFDKWAIENLQSQSGQTFPRYRIDKSVWLKDPNEDFAANQRTISGRILLLPQPTYSLGETVKQLLKNIDPKVLAKEYQLDATEQEELKNGIDRLPFLSAPMSGFTDHLLTMVQGTHIKPAKRAPGAQPEPLQEAIDACKDAEISADHLRSMDIQTNKTPYGSSVPVNARNSPFKPVTHGQWQFSKLNVVDKFGQALTIIDQTPRKFTDPEATVYPCVSDYFTVDKVQVSHNNQPPVLEWNSILEEPDNKVCHFLQVPPTINQACRLNTTFVIPDGKNKGLWREAAADYENPVWGWVVVNYADYGIQLFLEDGTFYREVRVNPPDTTGLGGSSVSPPWAPFDPPNAFNPNHVTQLDKLVQQLVNPGPKGDYEYLFAFANMINTSILNMPHLPNSFAGFLPGLVGKPLALVNLGMSLELAEPPLKSQSNVTSPKGEEPTLDKYNFPVKIGDGKRAFDGLVGYFPSVQGSVDLDLSQLYTYFPMKQPPTPPPPTPIHINVNRMDLTTGTTTGTDPTIAIGPDNYPTVTPFYVPTAPSDEWDHLSGDPPPAPSSPTTVDDFILLRNKQLQVFGAVIDPFSSIHFYSGSLVPVVSLKLPDWALGDAMKHMTAFFHAGPVLVTKDVPIDINPNAILKADYTLNSSSSSVSRNLSTDPSPPDETPAPAVQVGGLGGKGREKWRWLQPYWSDPVTSLDENVETRVAERETTGKMTQYNALPLTFSSTKPRLEEGPYTALEGYLQLEEPIVKPTM